jgi:pyruvate formate lyase activating enzyme
MERDGYTLGAWKLDTDGCCSPGGTRCPGVFEPATGSWGARRLPVRL